MAKIALVCTRNPDRLPEIQLRMREFLAALQPDNFSAHLEVRSDSSAVLGLYHVPEHASDGMAAYVGWLRQRSWDDPVGSFGMFRADRGEIELRADAVASRTIWVAHDEETFVAATSQRAIPWFLGGFQPNDEAMAWMLSSGTLGPGHGWDLRARPLGPYAKAVFDRDLWRLTIREPQIALTPLDAPVAQQRKRVDDVVREACNTNFSGWAICISGGRDSRNILQRIPDRAGLSGITWGTAEALQMSTSDALIARQLAERYGIAHTYYPTDLGCAEAFLARYLVAGDGRIDHIGGYTDGFELWRKVAASGVTGVIRGENLFGCKAASSPRDAGPTAGMTGLEAVRVPGLEHLRTTVPGRLANQPAESGQDYYHRLMHGFRQPVVLAALTELKSAYTEVANPLLSQPVIEVARSLPSALRDNKALFNSLADKSVPFATRPAIESVEALLEKPQAKTLLLDVLHSQRTRERFSDVFVQYVSQGLVQARVRKPGRLHRFRMRVLGKLGHDNQVRRVSGHRLALRAYIVDAMHERLARDGAY